MARCGIFRGAPELIEIARAHRRIALLHQPLVGDGLSLHIAYRGVPALAVITVEHVFAGGAVKHRRELIDQIESIVHAAVHAHAADRIVDMRAVAGEQNAALAKGRSDALGDAIDIHVFDLVAAVARKEPLQPLLDAIRVERGLLGLVRPHRE